VAAVEKWFISRIKWLIVIVGIVGFNYGCGIVPLSNARTAKMPLDEPYRPQYHFTPPARWMNDPNGLVYFAGEYHLFYQHNPDDSVWGPMHWGHAVSRDLINWQHLPIALFPDENGTIFSGSAVIDWRNTAGFGKEAMIAIFTHDQNGRQSQSLAYSTDKGRIWAKFAGNPILKPPNNIRNFRDPKVFWYGDAETGHWVMAVTGGTVILFFSSPDLKNWTPTGGFGFGYGSTEGVWETPDLFPLQVDGSADTRWVLSVGVGDGGPAGGGSGTQYFIGSFDGAAFTSENPKDTILWADFGADFYAAQSWNEAPSGRRLWLGWLNNWRYATAIPTATWRGAFTLPRQLSLATTPDGIRLVQQPIPELEKLRGKHWDWQNETIAPGVNLLAGLNGETLEILAEFQITPNMDAGRLGFRVRSENGEQTTIGYTTKSRTLFIDRAECGQTEFSPAFPGVHFAQMDPQDGLIRLHIFVDRASVDVFGNDGLVALTDQIFPCAGSTALELFADGGSVQVTNLTIYQLTPATFWLPAEADR
jgi:fructan beta-fructosidase